MNFYYNLNGGINTARTRIGLGQDTKRLFWWDSYNVEIYKNQGVKRQKGNQLVLKLAGNTPVLGLCEYPKATNDLLFLTEDKQLYSYSSQNDTITLLHTFEQTVSEVSFTDFLDGVVIATNSNESIYYNINNNVQIQPLGLEDSLGDAVCSVALSAYAGRLWVAKGSTLYFSAVGTFNDWTTAEDAGYISKFHSSTSEIIALAGYCGQLAIYKTDSVWLLSGSSPENFEVVKFANIGTMSDKSIVTAANKQFFANKNGVFCLAQAGILSQIALSDNFAINIQSYFKQIDYTKTRKTFALPYEIRNQLWFFLPFVNNDSLNTVFIYDFHCDAWTKRVIPYQITCGASVCGKIYTGSSEGEIFVEDTGNNFASKAIEFRFSSPFFNLGKPTVRKIIEDFNFIFDEECENHFKFGISKDYISQERTDVDYINTAQPNCLVWVDDSNSDDFGSKWADDSADYLFEWAEPLEEAYKTEIFDANTAVQLHVEGDSLADDFAIVGLEFKEILIDE